MKLRATIIEEVLPEDKSIIVKFEDDPANCHFEVHLRDINPYNSKLRKWDLISIVVKWESEIFVDKNGKKSYFTHLIGSKVVELNSPYSKD